VNAHQRAFALEFLVSHRMLLKAVAEPDSCHGE